MDYEVFRRGDRVQLHPATDLWMRGARYGTVVRVGKRFGTVYVALDALPNRTYAFAPQCLILTENGDA